MAFIVPFETEFCGEIRKVYAVNNDNPTARFGSCTTLSEVCPHCGERNFFRVYNYKKAYKKEGWGVEVYDCKCPSCRKEFDLEIEFEIDT